MYRKFGVYLLIYFFICPREKRECKTEVSLSTIMNSSPTQIILDVLQKQASRNGYNTSGGTASTLFPAEMKLSNIQGRMSPLLPRMCACRERRKEIQT